MAEGDQRIDAASGRLAVGVMLVLLILAMMFMKLRMLFLDAPFMLANIINAGHPMIMEHRYGSIITQIWPWLGMQLDLPLVWLMQLYNFAFNAFYLCVALLLVFRWRQYDLAVLLALYYTLMAGAAFYWTNNEIHQSVAWFFVWWGLYRYQKIKNVPIGIRIFTFELTALLAVITHPLMIPVIFFTWIFETGRHLGVMESRKNIVLFTAQLIGVILIRILLSLYSGWYDQDKLLTVRNNFTLNPAEIVHKPLFAELIREYLTTQWLATLFFVVSLLLLLYHRKYMLTVAYLAFVAGYHFLFLSAFDHWIDFYSQSELMPLSIIIGIPALSYLPVLLKGRSLFIIFFLIFTYRIFIIYEESNVFQRRLDKTQAILREMKTRNISKAIIPENANLQHEYLMTWGLPSESLILSSIRNDGDCRTFKIITQKDTVQALQTLRNSYLDCFKQVPASELNSRYFRIDTSSGYQLLQVK
ncbi:MAG: hypothetical protein J5I59_05835 [Saprospiraceae bacterium]|nr:hypothetical protein [Saprospiraceae bacterium]